MKVVIADSFLASMSKLDGALQPLVKQKAFDFQINPENPGFKYHRLENAKDKNFWSIRVNDDIRIIIHRTADTNVLCFTGHHDPAYRWAEKRRLEIHPDTGAAQVVVIDERIEEVVKRVVREVEEEHAVFGKYDPEYLQALGVPVEWLDAVRHIGASRLAELIDVMPEEAAERLLELAEGRPVARPQHIVGDPFTHPDAQRRFKVVDSNDELRQALDAGWEKWVVFLHPDQRLPVDKSFSERSSQGLRQRGHGQDRGRAAPRRSPRACGARSSAAHDLLVHPGRAPRAAPGSLAASSRAGAGERADRAPAQARTGHLV